MLFSLFQVIKSEEVQAEEVKNSNRLSKLCKFPKKVVIITARSISFDTFVLSYIHSFFMIGSLPGRRRFDYEVPLVATNENMATGSEPAVKNERM